MASLGDGNGQQSRIRKWVGAEEKSEEKWKSNQTCFAVLLLRNSFLGFHCGAVVSFPFFAAISVLGWIKTNPSLIQSLISVTHRKYLLLRGVRGLHLRGLRACVKSKYLLLTMVNTLD